MVMFKKIGKAEGKVAGTVACGVGAKTAAKVASKGPAGIAGGMGAKVAAKKASAAAGPSGAPKPGMGMGEKMKAKLDKQERKMPYKPGEGGRGLPPKPAGGTGAKIDAVKAKAKAAADHMLASKKPAGGMAPKGAGPTQSDMAAKAKAPKKLVSLPKPAAPAPGMKSGGSCKKYARGGGIEVRGKTKGRII